MMLQNIVLVIAAMDLVSGANNRLRGNCMTGKKASTPGKGQTIKKAPQEIQNAFDNTDYLPTPNIELKPKALRANNRQIEIAEVATSKPKVTFASTLETEELFKSSGKVSEPTSILKTGKKAQKAQVANPQDATIIALMHSEQRPGESIPLKNNRDRFIQHNLDHANQKKHKLTAIHEEDFDVPLEVRSNDDSTPSEDSVLTTIRGSEDESEIPLVARVERSNTLDAFEAQIEADRQVQYDQDAQEEIIIGNRYYQEEHAMSARQEKRNLLKQKKEN